MNKQNIMLFKNSWIGLRFSLSKTFETAPKKSCAAFCHEIGCENDQTYIFRFIRYLSTFFYTYLLINIHFQFIIITNISFSESDFHWTFLKMIIDIFHPPILGQVNIGLYLEKSRDLRTWLLGKQDGRTIKHIYISFR
jgi:hypothetical protein